MGFGWRVRVGAPWPGVPECDGSWQVVSSLFRRWQPAGAWAGVWAQILARRQALADLAGLITWDVNLDSTIMRAHQHAAGAPAESSTNQMTMLWATLGAACRPRCNLACEQGQKPLSLLVTAAQRGDAPQLEAVMTGNRGHPTRLSRPSPTRSGTTPIGD